MPQFFPVDDPLDERIEAYRDIRERDLAGRGQYFIAEGEVVLRMLASGVRHEADSVLIAAKRRDKLAPLLARLPEATPVYLAAQGVLDGIAGFHLHRGILALGRRPALPAGADLIAALGSRAVVLALSGIANHDNMGGIFRNAAAFAADAVILDAECCDPLYRKAIRVSAGACLTVPYARLAPGEDAVALLETHGFECLALSPAGGTSLASLRRAPRAAVLLGSEGPGLPEDILARARTVAIPMAPGVDSLNVATTSGIVLHHLAFVG